MITSATSEQEHVEKSFDLPGMTDDMKYQAADGSKKHQDSKMNACSQISPLLSPRYIQHHALAIQCLVFPQYLHEILTSACENRQSERPSSILQLVAEVLCVCDCHDIPFYLCRLRIVVG